MPPSAISGAGAARTPAPTRYRLGIAAILFIVLLVSYLDRSNVGVLVANPQFLADMGIADDPARKGLLLTVFMFTYGIANIVLAPLGGRIGPRKAMCAAVVIWAIAVLLGGMAGTFGFMLGTRVLLGAGEGLHWPMQSLYVTHWFPPAERARANSAWLLGLMVGPMFAIPLINHIIIGYGWRASFWALAALSILPLALLWFLAPDHPRGSRCVGQPELDYIETALAAERAGLAAAQPAAPSRAFLADWRFWFIAFSYLCSAGLFFGVLAWLPSYLHQVRGFSFAQMGWMASLPYVLGTLTVLVSGFVADRFTHKGIFPTIAMLGAAVCVYCGARSQGNVAAMLLIAAAIGFVGVGMSSYWTMLQNIVPRAVVGQAAGVMNGVGQIGASFIPTIVGGLIGWTHSYDAGLMFLVGLTAFGGVLMLVLAVRRV